MIYLSGHWREELATAHPKLGLIVTPMSAYLIPENVTWAADSGCFAKPEAFVFADYLVWLERWRSRQARCLFVTAPDRLGDAAATLALFDEAAPQLRALGYPVALVAQDGLMPDMVPWGALDALFIGGTTEWKLSEAAYALIAAAKERGKWVHCGRVNSARRYRAMASAGCDSADGTFLAFGPTNNMRRLRQWLEMQPLREEEHHA